MSAGLSVRQVMERNNYGMLASISNDGFPFGSLVSFTMAKLDGVLNPVMLMSDLAEHTKNIKADPKVSLMVMPASDDPQASARVTWIGEVSLADELREEYALHIPSGPVLLGMKDFHMYKISLISLRYIAGFGRILWVEPKEFDEACR